MTIDAGFVQPTSRGAFRPAALCPVTSPKREDAGADLSATLASALDTLDDGLVVTTERGLVVHANQAAQAMVAAGALAVWNGQLCAAASTDTRTLRTAIAACARDGQTCLLRLEGLQPHQRLMVTLHRAAVTTSSPGRSGPMVVAVLRDETPVALPAPQLQAMFGLTLAEARLAREVMHGDGLQACARRLGVAANTARTHLNRVFDKTGTKRQAELVRLLLGCRRS